MYIASAQVAIVSENAENQGRRGLKSHILKGGGSKSHVHFKKIFYIIHIKVVDLNFTLIQKKKLIIPTPLVFNLAEPNMIIKTKKLSIF